ncbi:hypothetical protein J4732_08030 [Serratia marcescens]|uniref:Uncharacterized protein n=1 Tax=Serratia marcescens TaxID=615 RepID=A0A939SV60_SERMA|nr:hypothetical protein [Serratia marcescens]
MGRWIKKFGMFWSVEQSAQGLVSGGGAPQQQVAHGVCPAARKTRPA